MGKGTSIKTKLAAFLRIFGLPMLALTAAQAQIPIISSQPASRTVWAGGSVTFAVRASGSGPFTYQWQLNGTNLPNGIITTVAGRF